MTKRLMCAAAVVLGVVAAPSLRAEIVEQVLVKVNGEIISLSEWEKRQFATLRGRPDLAKLPPGSPQLARAIAESTPTLILGAVDELLWVQRAREHGWALTKERFADIVADIKKSNPDIADEASFKKALQAEGMTEDDLFKQIERDMLLRQVQQQDVTNKMSVSEDEIKVYYDAHRSEFTTPAELTLREILIPVPVSDRGVNVAQDEEARAKAASLRKRLADGEPFPKMAAEESAAPSKSNGGLIGPVKLDELNPPFPELLGPMKVGEITDVVATSRGYHILRIETRSETKSQSLEDARAAVSRQVMQEKSQGEILKYLEKLRAQAKIVILNDELKRAYEEALAERRQRAGIPAPPPPAAPAPKS